MWAVIRRNPLAALLALVLHLLLAGFLIFGVDWWDAPQPMKPKAPPIQAQVIDGQKLEAEKQRQAQAEQRKLDEVKRKAEAEKRKQEQAQRRAAEEKRKAEEEQLRQEAAKRKAAEEKRKQEAAKRAAAEAKRKQEEAERKAAEEKRKQEAKRKAEAARKAEEAREAEAARKAEEARKAEAARKAEEARKAAAQKAREDALRAQMEAEENAREIELYVGSIKRQIELKWLQPPNAGSGLRCTLKVRLIPGGDVVPGSVRVIAGSGNERFDRSVEAAVYKASPLPVPSGKLFESFRELTLVFDPD